MISLFRAEARRAFSRRLFLILVLLAVAGILTGATITFFTSNTDVNAARARAEEDFANCRQEAKEFRENTVENGEPAPQIFCGTVDERLAGFDKSFRYAQQVPDVTRGIGIFALTIAVVMGASFVGAEWGTGAMSTFLTWEPRRGRVLAAKAIVIFVLVGLLVSVLLALLAVVLLPAGHLRGSTDGMTWEFWRTLSGVWGKAGALGGLFAIFGAALATITRNTAGGIGAASIYMLIGDPILGAWREARYRDWLFQYNIARFLGIPVPSGNERDGFGPEMLTQAVLSPWRPALLLSIYISAVLVAAYLTFRTRDVT